MTLLLHFQLLLWMTLRSLSHRKLLVSLLVLVLPVLKGYTYFRFKLGFIIIELSFVLRFSVELSFVKNILILTKWVGWFVLIVIGTYLLWHSFYIGGTLLHHLLLFMLSTASYQLWYLVLILVRYWRLNRGQVASKLITIISLKQWYLRKLLYHHIFILFLIK